MHLFDGRGVMRRYGSAADVLADFLPIRAGLYACRHARSLALLRGSIKLSSQH
jgi:hypothetical protein